ncbi:MAG: hypothetical protein WA771_13175 [Chthoniobacterales bacterium]
MTRETTLPTPRQRRRIPPLALVLLSILACLLPNLQADEEFPSISEGAVVVVPLDGPVTKAQFVFLRRILKEAETAKASAFVIDMNTPGGRLDVTEDIVKLLTKSTLPTYTWVNTHAASAGALISLATDHIYMAPISAIGAAAPIMGDGSEIPETANEKAKSFNSALYRGVAEQKGYRPELADAFIDPNAEFKIGDDVISPKDSLLTLNATEATKNYEGKPLLASGIADDIAELKELAGLQGATVEIEPSGFERAAQIITSLAPLFLLGGIIGAYLEFKSPGFGVAGLVSAACFLIFFTGHSIAGLTGMEVVAVFVLGLLLVAFELFLFPGLIVISVVGSALMLGSILYAMIDYYPGDPVIPSVDVLVVPMINLGITLVLAIVIISLLARYLPDLPIFRRIILASQVPAGASITHSPRDLYDLDAEVGDTGIARTDLRPSGKAQIGTAWVDVITEGEYLACDTPIRVLESTPNRILVTKDTARA